MTSGLAAMFAGIALVSALVASLVSKTKYALLALWVVGLSVAGMYLSVDAELLAVVQCIQCTLVTIAFVFFSVMFGEFSANGVSLEVQTQPVQWGSRDFRKSVVFLILGSIIGLIFALIIWRAARDLPGSGNVAMAENGIQALGQTLVQEHLLSLEVLALTLFLVLVGGGVVARLEKREDS